jgi:DNA-binding HxlR family transcriptional regulator
MQTSSLAHTICVNSGYLIKDLYGNYVVQTVLRMNVDKYTVLIISAVKDNILEFGQLKASSNVVERCIEIAPT